MITSSNWPLASVGAQTALKPGPRIQKVRANRLRSRGHLLMIPHDLVGQASRQFRHVIEPHVNEANPWL